MTCLALDSPNPDTAGGHFVETPVTSPTTQLRIKHPDNKNGHQNKPPIWKSWRLTVSVLGCMAMCSSFASQASMTSAMVCMIYEDNTDPHNTTTTTTTTNNTNTTSLYDPFPGEATTVYETSENNQAWWKLTWNSETQGLVVSSFFVGYYVMQIPAGVMVTRFARLGAGYKVATAGVMVIRLGPKTSLVAGLLSTGILHICSIPVALWNVTILYVIRIVAGLTCACMLPGVYALIANWAPSQETSFMFGIAGVGIELGNSMAFFLSLFGCETDVQGGWPFVFYVLGGAQILLGLTMFVAITDFPVSHKYIDPSEERYISNNRTHTDKAKSIPIRKIMTSLPVWSFLIIELSIECMYYTFITQGPLYLRDVIKLQPWQTNLLGSLPFLVTIPIVLCGGRMSDNAIQTRRVTKTRVRKLNQAYASVLTATAVLSMGFLPRDDWVLAFVIYLTMAVGITGTYAGYMANPGDLSPAHAGFLAGLGQALTMWVAFVIPAFTGYLTKQKDRSSWQFLFALVVGLEAFALVIYLLFGSGNLQPWADGSVEDTEETPIMSREHKGGDSSH